jgi:hypothetical protein
MLLSQSQPRGDDRERITRARQAAEALFTSKPPVSEPSVPEFPTPTDQSARKPRVLRIISPAAPVRHHEKVKSPVGPEPPSMRAIPRSEFARIRAWVKYGMMASEVAQVYGTDVGGIERIIRQA